MTGGKSKPATVRISPRPRILPTSGWSTLLIALVAGAMSFLAVLTLAASMSAAKLAAEWKADLAGVATVRITGATDEIDEKVAQVVEVLRTTPGITRIKVLSDSEQADLLAPWLGEATDISLLPAPRLIDVVLDGRGPDDEALQQRLDLTVSGARYDDHAAWRAPLAAASGALRRLALGATVLVLLTAGIMVAFATRATLAANAHVIATVRLMGADEGFVAGAYIRGLTRRSAIGSLLGALVAAGTLMTLPKIETDQALAEALSPDTTGWLILTLGVPLATALVTWFAARWAVRVVLRRMP